MSTPNQFSRSAVKKISILSIDPGESAAVTAHYNPKELQIEKTIPWTKTSETNRSNGQGSESQGIHLEFTGAEGRTMTLELLFDEEEFDTIQGEKGVAKSVSDSIKTLEKLASVRKPGSTKDAEKRPHFCQVVWGSDGPLGPVDKFRCVIDSLTTKYTMFDAAGKPLRATCTVKLKEADVLSTAKAEGRASSTTPRTGGTGGTTGGTGGTTGGTGGTTGRTGGTTGGTGGTTGGTGGTTGGTGGTGTPPARR